MNAFTKPLPSINPVILLDPLVINGNFYKGVVWICFPDVLLQRYPDVKKYFIVISTSASCSWSHTSVEDIHALTVGSDIEGFKDEFPDRDYILLHDTHFISEDDFYPVQAEKEYDLIFPSRLNALKRHHVFIEIMYILKNKYRRNIKALVIARPDYWPIRISNIFKPSLTPKNIVSNVKREFYGPIMNLYYKKAIMDGLDISLIRKLQNIGSLRLFHSKSKIYLLLSTNEGTTRTTREALLCNTPVLTIKDCPAAEAYVNNYTGKTVEDDPDSIAREIIKMVDNYKDYSPRQWAVGNEPRRIAGERLWEKINSIQRFPGYPDINAANDIRKQFTKNKYDNYSDLNNFKGHYGKNVEFFNSVFFDKRFTEVRIEFNRYTGR